MIYLFININKYLYYTLKKWLIRKVFPNVPDDATGCVAKYWLILINKYINKHNEIYCYFILNIYMAKLLFYLFIYFFFDVFLQLKSKWRWLSVTLKLWFFIVSKMNYSLKKRLFCIFQKGCGEGDLTPTPIIYAFPHPVTFYWLWRKFN